MPDICILLCAMVLLSSLSLSATSSDAKSDTNAPGTYKILTDDQTKVTIPFKMLHNKPVMEAKINGKQAFLTIDNGRLWDDAWLFGTALSEEIALEEGSEGTIEGAGDGESTQASFANNLCISFDGIEFYNQSAYISPASAGFASAFKGMDGQICNTFFSHFVVEFDFHQGLIILHDPASFRYSGEGSVLDIKRESSGSCSLPISFTLADGKKYQGRADMDLGGVEVFMVALNNHNMIDVPEGAKTSKLYGAQGEFTVYESAIKELSIGKYKIIEPVVKFCDEASGSIHPDNLGAVGLPLLQRFNPIFDYGHDLLYLQPENHSNR